MSLDKTIELAIYAVSIFEQICCKLWKINALLPETVIYEKIINSGPQ